MKTLEEQVREIADREEIKELTAKYAHWVALGEGAKVAQLFTDDGAFINEVIAPSVVDPGWPVFEPATALGEAGQSTQLGGYAIVTADDLQAAVSMAEHCPTITRGGGVEVGVLAALPPEHPAEQIRSRLSKA